MNNYLEIIEMHDNFDLAALLAMVQMLNRKGLTRIRIPDPEESESI